MPKDKYTHAFRYIICIAIHKCCMHTLDLCTSTNITHIHIFLFFCFFFFQSNTTITASNFVLYWLNVRAAYKFLLRLMWTIICTPFSLDDKSVECDAHTTYTQMYTRQLHMYNNSLIQMHSTFAVGRQLNVIPSRSI